MKSGTFTVKLKFEYGAEGIYEMKVPIINGAKGKQVPYIESDKDTHLGTIGTMIILTTRKEPEKAADPCGWVWNPILKKWFWRCWNSAYGDR